jgi:hypothetical protein
LLPEFAPAPVAARAATEATMRSRMSDLLETFFTANLLLLRE